MKTAAALALMAVGVGCDNKTTGEIKPEGSAGPAAAPAMTEWRVGAYLSLSGENTAFGIDTREGIELAVDDINKIDRATLDYVQKKYPKYLQAPEKWEEPSLSSLEWYAREQKAAPVPAGGQIPRAADPELPAWFKAMMQRPQS